MHGKDAIRNAYQLSQMILTSYVGDLSDAELLIRPGEGCNHIAYQLGHLIQSENDLLQSVVPGAGIELPEGFGEKHGKENTASDDPADFLGKDDYLALLAKVKEATFAALDAQSDADLAKDPPEFLKQISSSAGDVFVLIATHGMMHAGQFVPVRRQCGKPVVI